MSRAKSAFARPAASALVLLGVLLAQPRAAPAQDEMHVCLSTYVETQKARRDGHLLAARRAADQCGREVCPAMIRDDCVRWQRELDQAIPTVVLSARTADGRDRADVTVSMDGAPLAGHLDGRAVPVDPGEHTFRFVAPDGASAQSRVLVREGERDRAVVGAFPPSTSAGPGAPASPAAWAGPSRPTPTAVWILGGAGVAAAAVAVTFWSLAAFASPGLFSELSCRPDCPPGSSGAMSERAKIGDVAGAIAVLGLGSAAYLYLTRSQRPAPPAVGLGLGPGWVTFTSRWR